MAVLQNQKIFTYDPVHAREISENYLSEYTERGQLFIVLETPQHNKINQQPLIDEFIQKTANYFDILKEENPEKLLEQILQKINQFLPLMAAESKIRNWLSGLAISVGIIHEDWIYLSCLGNINAINFHHNQIVTLTQKGQPISPTKIFADLSSGQMSEGDALIVATDSLFDYISLEKIRQIIKQYTAEAAVRKINSLLEGVPDFVTFNALLIKKPGLADMELAVAKTNNEDEAESDTELPSQGTIFAPDNTPKNFRARTPQLKSKLVVDPRGFNNFSFFRKVGRILAAIGLFFKLVYVSVAALVRAVKKAALFIFSKNYRRRQENRSLENISRLGEQKINWWQQLSLLKKISLLTLLVIALIFLQSLVFSTQNKAEQNKDQSYDQLIVDVNRLMGEEKNAQEILKDEIAAEKILVEIQDKLNRATPRSAQQQQEISAYQEKISHELNQVRHIHEVPAVALSEIADLSTKLVSAEQIVQKNGVFYILDLNLLYQWSPPNNFEQIATFENSRLLSDWPNKNKLLVGNDKQFYIFDLDSHQLNQNPINKVAANNDIKDISVYGDNLYVLDTQAGQIFKYPQSGDSFGSGQAWLKTKQDLSQASSIAIDGNLYIVDNQGNIKKYLKGDLQEFDYHQPRPIIGPGAIIKTFRDSQYLYIVDPYNKRVIILDKNGQIKEQWTSASFDKLTDLAVDLGEKVIYLLNGNHLYLLPVNQTTN
ncbi:MAG: hypothetical protein C3F02_02460 [Parcubacteria group bacterium]|nr:MAG: hypothetical protein C3F02_02460 [Parcubacteria group bacterium]